MAEILEFDLEPDDHRYTLRGSEIPATTRVLTLARPSMDGIPRRLVAEARDRSIETHKAVELHARNDLDRRTLRRDVKHRFDKFLWFMDFYKVKIVELPLQSYGLPNFVGGALCEVPLVHPVWRFGVTADLGFCTVDGLPSVVELKVMSTHNDATALQLASQQNTINHFFERFGYKVEGRFSVRLPADGKPDVRRYTDASDWSTFLSFLNVYNWRAVHKIGAKDYD